MPSHTHRLLSWTKLLKSAAAALLLACATLGQAESRNGDLQLLLEQLATVVFTLVTYGANGDGATVDSLQQRDRASATKRNFQLTQEGADGSLAARKR